MIIGKAAPAGAAARQPADRFTGEVWIDSQGTAPGGPAMRNVLFLPRSRTHWHSHSEGQLLVVRHGRGLVGRDGEAPTEIAAGDVVWAPPGERHWHGASPDSQMLHLAVSFGETHWQEEVADGDYWTS
jgi:quercetin dioxygenase-like cupin family protein